ncbi:hypothetical protein [Ramlibacter sp.]|uniref:tetratricopeptide repeat protein n=1 Tax=Ramlibacter sp. TaxID=1917967 RepID=UPI0017B64FCF|nr:hypothetical protein [Ramlibacter sp.]MBA2675085.1 hypothetical protein [Ramlibacter sp.]
MSHEMPATGSGAEDPRTLLDMGIAASMADRPAQALALFAQAAAAAPTWALPHFLLGSEYAAQSDIGNAEAALANAVLLDPELHIARYQLGLLQFSSGRAAAALVTWQPLSALEGLQGLPAFVRGFAAMAQDDFAGAKQHFHAGLAQADINAAVAGDIRKVLADVEALRVPGVASAPAPVQPAEISSTAHVLVSAYDKYKLH